MDAAVSILKRARLLQVPADEPVGVVKTKTEPCRTLKDSDVTRVMRAAVKSAFPDPNSYLRINIKRIGTHSARVTAAVCLKQGGAADDEIAFRLRWHLSSVPTYLRDCFQAVGKHLQQTVYGACMKT